MLKAKLIAFPQMGDYHVPIKYLLKNISDSIIIDAPNITAKTIELGNRYSPEFVCTPFKYTLGTYIECLELGANVLIQLGGGCRYGYYSELQEQILKDLGYNFILINLITAGRANFKDIIKKIKKIGKINYFKALAYLFITIKMIKYMDKIDVYIRENMGFELEKNSFKNLKEEMLVSFSNITSYLDLRKKYKQYYNKFKSLSIDKPDDCLKVAIIGELYTIMEPFANYELEAELARNRVSITRYTNADYLMFKKKRAIQKFLKLSHYVKYRMGADASDNVYRCEYLCQHHYDGIIHIKSSFCTPEIAIMPIISKICGKYKVPLLFFSFDANTSEVGMKTRLEAFYDMLKMKRNK
ncbi:MAG: 2-hydroxyacyl-CoA dehydratase [Bacilli bacterium]|nr:2-hydroxyacyl-CoA dehydratase [Bacilli bacterium]MDD4808919.1 2-hydroxyacyl-CoA dehydratase [Bacilli bacterium]